MFQENKIYYLSPEFITHNFWPADYSSTLCRPHLCSMYSIGYHDCDGTIQEHQWNRVLKWARLDMNYPKIHQAIKNKGFLVPLATRLNRDLSITLYDGHHRTAVAQDLNLSHIPVYIGETQMNQEDLHAHDSNHWDGKTIDSPFLGTI